MWKRFFREHRWYIVTLGAALLITLSCLYAYWGTREIQATHSQNVARVDSLDAAINALPKVASIAPAQTSGLTEYTATARLQLAAAIEKEYAPRYASWLFVPLPLFFARSVQQSDHQKIADEIASSLKVTARDLTEFKKFIEYMPLVDLSGAMADDAGRGERLNRTKQGLDDTIELIRWSGLPHSDELVAQLSKLNAHTLTLTDETKEAWSLGVLEAQKLLVKDIESRDVYQSVLQTQLETLRSS